MSLRCRKVIPLSPSGMIIRCPRRAIRSARPALSRNGCRSRSTTARSAPRELCSGVSPGRVTERPGVSCDCASQAAPEPRFEKPTDEEMERSLVRLDRIEVWSARAYVFQALPGRARSVRQGMVGLFRDGRVVYIGHPASSPHAGGPPVGGAASTTSGPRCRRPGVPGGEGRPRPARGRRSFIIDMHGRSGSSASPVCRCHGRSKLLSAGARCSRTCPISARSSSWRISASIGPTGRCTARMRLRPRRSGDRCSPVP